MKNFIDKITKIKNIIGLIFIVFYFLYVSFSMNINKGNNVINSILLTVTIIYLIMYVFTTFIFENKRIKKISKRTFKRVRKTVGFINTVLILVSVITAPSNSIFTIIFSVLSIIGYIIYVLIDIGVTYLKHQIKGLVSRHDHRS